MKTYTLTVLCTLCSNFLALGQSNSIRWLEQTPEGVVSAEGNLSDGIDMPDISWAWNSAVACFPATQAAKFTGTHVLYAIDLPAYTELEIDLIPAEKSANFSLYAYVVGTVSDKNTVPNLSQCIRCEADHKWDYKVKGKTQDHRRHVRDILAISNPYQVIIGVVGADGLKEGAYRLEVRRKA